MTKVHIISKPKAGNTQEDAMDKLSITSAIIPTKIHHMNLNMRKSDKMRNCPVIFKPVNLKGNQLWIFTGKTNAEAEVPMLRASGCEELTH